MKRWRLAAGLGLVSLVVAAVWIAGVGQQTAQAPVDGTEDAAYDYEASDVVVRQMAPDGSLQYELEAKQISQLPHNGQISASDLIMHYDPEGSAPDGRNRWTLTAETADLPDDGSVITLNGSVRARGVPANKAGAPVLLATEQLRYDLTTQDLASDMPVDFTWGGGNTMRGAGLRANIKTGAVAQSRVNVTLAP